MDPAMAIEVAAIAQQKPMLAAMAQGESEVQRFYNNSVVFLTGGSGFLGKQLIEKLFRCCQISKAYILMRAKKGKNIRERLLEILKDPVFDTLYEKQPDLNTKIFAIEGDVADIKLGIKDEDWKILTTEVDVIFHVAATTRFDEALRTATFINIRGTREALLLGKACKKLRSFVHVSTAYCHASPSLIGGDVQEKFYRTPIPPDTMISLAEHVQLERLNNLSPDLIKGWPNTYTFTKAIAEELVRTTSDGLPICIVRPAVVLSTYREPSPGWVDLSCIYGFVGLILGGGMGVIHVCLGDIDIKCGFIPCDYVNNAIIVAARETATNQTKGGTNTKIYTVCTTERNPVYFRLISDTLHNKARHIATPKMVYYAFSIYTVNKIWFMILSFFLHVIPAYMADFVCILLGKQRRFAKLAKKLNSIFSVLSYFTLNEWNFVDKNLESLYSGLSKQDKAIFNFDVTDIDWQQYLLLICIGLRKYIVKDGLKGTEYGLKKQKYLRVGHYIFTTLYLYCIWKMIYFTYSTGCSLLSIVA